MATGIENLKIYQLAKELEVKVYRITSTFPRDERFRSIDQLRRSSSSVTNNIAESYNKQSIKDKIHILRDVAISEAEETRSNLFLCAAKEFTDKSSLENLAEKYRELMMATNGYIRFLKTSKLTN